MNILEGNIIIADFIDLKNTGMGIYKEKDYKFKTSYDWIYKAIDKIESSGYQFDVLSRRYPLSPGKDHQVIIYNDSHENKILEYTSDSSKLHAMYHAVLKFIEYYNKK